MDDIILNSSWEVNDFFCHLRKIGSGREGICYRKGNNTYKRYNELYSSLYSNDIMIYRLLRFRNEIIDNIYFIRSLIYCNDSVVGSICDYAGGISCAKAKLHQTKIDKLIRSLSVLKKNVYELSELGIYMDDNYLGNFLFDGNSFKLIDMGGCFHFSEVPIDCCVENIGDISVIYKNNMSKIMKKLFVNITDKYYSNDNFIYAFLWDIDSPYKYYLEDSDLMINPDDTIMGIRNTICEYIGYEIDRFSKCRNDLLRIRKK